MEKSDVFAEIKSIIREQIRKTHEFREEFKEDMEILRRISKVHPKKAEEIDSISHVSYVILQNSELT